MPIARYLCEKCKRTFDCFEKAIACEDSHLVPVEARVISYSIKPYPYSVEITFSDGSKGIYNAESLGG